MTNYGTAHLSNGLQHIQYSLTNYGTTHLKWVATQFSTVWLITGPHLSNGLQHIQYSAANYGTTHLKWVATYSVLCG